MRPISLRPLTMLTTKGRIFWKNPYFKIVTRYGNPMSPFGSPMTCGKKQGHDILEKAAQICKERLAGLEKPLLDPGLDKELEDYIDRV